MSLYRRFTNLFSLSKLDREIDAELQSHIQLRTDDNIARGMSPEAARRDALLRFGNPTITRHNTAGADAMLLIASFFSDLRFTFRQLARNPGFALTAIFVLALGTCAAITLFAFVDAVLVKPLPYSQPSQLVVLYESSPMGPQRNLSWLDFADWRDQNKVFSATEAFAGYDATITTPAGPEYTQIALTTTGFLRTLGITPILGRDFTPAESQLTTSRIALISYAAWQKRFGGNPNILGQSVTLDERPITIIGVLPKDFYFSPVGAAEFWTIMSPDNNPVDRGEHSIRGLARLRPGISLQSASANVSTIMNQIARLYPDHDGGRGATVVPLTQVVVGTYRPFLLLLLAGSILLCFIACINAGSLVLLRAENRRRETAIRGALGASLSRLTRQLVTESLALSAIGVAIGIASAFMLMHLAVRLIPAYIFSQMPYLHHLGLSFHVVLFAAAIGIITAALFALIALSRLSVSNLRGSLTDGARSSSSTLWRNLGAKFVVLELTLSVVLLVSAGLLGKSFYKLLHTDIGLNPQNLATVHINAPDSAYKTKALSSALANQILIKASHLPGVQSAAITRTVPVSNGDGNNSTFSTLGLADNHENNRIAAISEVGDSYFSTIQTRLLRGRFFTAQDDSTHPIVVIVNQTFAQKYFPAQNVIGKQVRTEDTEPWTEIIGVVADMHDGPLDAPVTPTLYYAFAQDPNTDFSIILRTAQDPGLILNSLTAAVRSIDHNLIVDNAETITNRINESQSAYLHRGLAFLIGAFAIAAFLLGITGLYGVIAYGVSQRTREIGVRMALGAQRSGVYSLILNEAARLTAIGILAGLACSVLTANLLKGLLYNTQPWDIATLLAVAASLAAAAMLASFIPAHRAASINPTSALRAE